MAAIICTAISAATRHISLDGSDPVVLLGDSIVYRGQAIALGPKAFFVDGSLSDSEASAHPYVFNSLQKAVERLADGTEEEPMRVYMAPWVYWADNPDDTTTAVGTEGRPPFGMVIRCNNLHLTGLTANPRNVVIAAQRGHMQGAMGNFTMLDIHGDGLQVSNLTMGNFCNADLDYPLEPSLQRPRRSDAITQAQVAYCHGDRAVARNVRFIGRLNLCPLSGARRIFYDRCHFECTDDALACNGVYLKCTIDLYGQKPLYTTAATGAVFLDCDFTVKNNNHTMAFCKVPGPLTLIDCRYHAPDSTYIGWANYPERWLRCYQAGFTLNGKPYRIGSRMGANTVCIDGKEALAAYKTVADGDTTYNTFNLLRGNDGWNPQGRATMPAGANGCHRPPLPTCLLANRRRATVDTGGKPVELQAFSALNGGYKPGSTADTATVSWAIERGFERYALLTDLGHGRCTVSSLNDDDTTVTFTVVAATATGLQAAVEVSAVPRPLPAPAFTEEPRLAMGDSITLCYGIDLRGREDRSRITWYRCRDSRGSGAIPVAVGRGGKPLRSYRFTRADAGWHIMASIEPAHVRSMAGKAVRVVTDSPVDTGRTPEERCVETDFSTLPTAWQPMVAPGFWTVDGHKPSDTQAYQWAFDRNTDMWTYGSGFNGARGMGLLQAQRGARLLYTPAEPHGGDMRVTLVVHPTKTAGQGFGSATGQYMDVYIKFDTRTLSGYALRIERTPKHAKAVDFRLMRYDNGKATPISEAVSATCYRTRCTITVATDGQRLTAHAETTAPPQAGSGLPNTVDLSADIDPSAHGGSGVQHTGSCGESTTMLHYMKIEYDTD